MGDAPVQILNIRVRGIGHSQPPELLRLPPGEDDTTRALVGRRPAYCFDTRAQVDFAAYRRQLLSPGDRVQGPAIIDEGTSTTVVHSSQSLSVDEYGHLLITVGAAG
jgi:N-methylhydantoinase A